MLGLVLSGGGARGAYEAGALRFVMEELPRRTGVTPQPKVICGTSIGAITGAWIGALGVQGARRLSAIWQEMEVDHVYNFAARDLLGLPHKLFRGARTTAVGSAMFDPAPLQTLMREGVPWGSLHDAIDSGHLRSFVVAATDVASGFCTLFADGVAPRSKSVTSRVLPTRIGAEHCLASAAIPLVFPAVEVEGRYYVDGALRQNTPLSPAISLGVDRALVIGVKRARVLQDGLPENFAPTPAFLAGKALNALMLDPVEEDIRRLRAMNTFLEWGEGAFPDFLSRVNSEHKPYRVVKTVHLRPSEDIGRMAADCYRTNGDQLPWASRMLLRAIAAEEPGQEADLLSYLMFHKSHTGELEALGFADAARQEEELAALFADDQIPPPNRA